MAYNELSHSDLRVTETAEGSGGVLGPAAPPDAETAGLIQRHREIPGSNADDADPGELAEAPVLTPHEGGGDVGHVHGDSLPSEAGGAEDEAGDIPYTTIRGVVEQDAQRNPGSWSERNTILFGTTHIALNNTDVGVRLDNSTPDSQRRDAHRAQATSNDDTVYATPDSTRAWRVNLYGSRWVTTGDGRTALSSVELERLPEVHQAIIESVLRDEHSRPSRFVPNAQQQFGKGYTSEDLQIWLETIHDGYSPIMATGEFNADGSPVYIRHDYADFHPASNMLWGRKTQDRVTVASGYELDRRQKNIPMPDEKGFVNAVRSIDSITCSREQLNLLDYAMFGPGGSPKERMMAAWQVVDTHDFNPYRIRRCL